MASESKPSADASRGQVVDAPEAVEEAELRVDVEVGEVVGRDGHRCLPSPTASSPGRLSTYHGWVTDESTSIERVCHFDAVDASVAGESMDRSAAGGADGCGQEMAMDEVVDEVESFRHAQPQAEPRPGRMGDVPQLLGVAGEYRATAIVELVEGRSRSPDRRAASRYAPLRRWSPVPRVRWPPSRRRAMLPGASRPGQGSPGPEAPSHAARGARYPGRAPTR